MIVENTVKAVNTTGLPTTNLSMKNSAQAYKILSSSLYENKERAVLRELTANGLDAHTEANVTTPVEITLPTQLSPELIVQDYGVGMDTDTVVHLFSTYFDSSKTQTNSLIGGFGLGSKSPLAISDTYTITTTKDGVTTIAAIYLDEGLPKLTLVSTSTTNASSGTTITVPVSDSSIQSNLAYEVHNDLFSYWEVLPVILNKKEQIQKKLKNTENNLVLETVSTWSRSYLLSNAFSKALVGNFIYALPNTIINRLEDDFSDTEVNDYLTATYSGGTSLRLIPVLPIGTIELAPSRERIENTEANYQAIKQHIETNVALLKNNQLTKLTTLVNDIYKHITEEPTYALYKKVDALYTASSEVTQHLFKKFKSISLIPDTVKNKITVIVNTFSTTSLTLENLVKVNFSYLNLTSYKYGKNSTIVSVDDSLLFYRKLINQETIYVVDKNTPKYSTVKRKVNYCINNKLPININNQPNVISLEDHFTVGTESLKKLIAFFGATTVLEITLDTVADITLPKTTTSRSTSAASKTKFEVLYSFSGIDSITAEKLYAKPPGEVIVVSSKTAEIFYRYDQKHKLQILDRVLTKTTPFIVVALPAKELSNKRYKNSNLELSSNIFKDVQKYYDTALVKQTTAKLTKLSNITRLNFSWGNTLDMLNIEFAYETFFKSKKLSLETFKLVVANYRVLSDVLEANYHKTASLTKAEALMADVYSNYLVNKVSKEHLEQFFKLPKCTARIKQLLNQKETT